MPESTDFDDGFVEDVLRQLHIVPADFRGDEILALCPGHLERKGREDSNPSWSINATTGQHLCYSCRFSGSLVYLVAYRLEMRSKWVADLLDFEAARQWLAERTTVNFEAILRRLEESSRTQAVRTKVVPMTEARLAVFDPPPDWALLERGLSRESVEHYGVLWDPEEQAWITPIRDPDTKRLWGWQAKGQGNRYFRNRPVNVKKSKTLFGWDVYDGGQAVAVESPLDCARLRTVGITGGISTMGAFISDDQVSMLRSVDRLVMAMDNDPAGKIASLEILKATVTKRFECWFLNYDGTDAKDVGDMSGPEARAAVETARHCVMGKQAIA